MSTETTPGRIRHFILNQFPLARQRAIGDEDPLLRTGILDSLGILEVVAFIESEFGIAVADEELVPESFESIATMARFVDGKRDHEGGA
ncbi:MAG TPA: acyl carrier protein [Candidatus Eisenbacteria bacterium]|nr:acyl carrier protein [Candidatus Eisenbacteria bacterium]